MQNQIDNPLLEEWVPPYELPPFDRVRPEHFEPAFETAFAAHDEEIAAIAGSGAAATFENTIEALERSGERLSRIASLFFNLAGADTNEALQAIERGIAPRLARHQNRIYLNAGLFARIEALYARRKDLALTDEQARVLERYHTRLARAGARLGETAKARMAEIGSRLAERATAFTQNALKSESAFAILLEGEEELEGLPGFLRRAAAAVAREAGHEGKYAITFSRSSIEPFLAFSQRRDLREQAHRAWLQRGASGGETDNRALIAEIAALRAERARLLGFESFAHFKLDDTMAKTPKAVRELLDGIWEPARRRALAERDALQALAGEEGANFELAPWDWRFYQERLRARRHALDEAEIKPYFQLERMIEAAFDTAGRLFGLAFEERPDLPRYHEDVRVWEVFDREGAAIALFMGDYFTRPSKRGGAWMSAYRNQQRLAGDRRPVIVNVMNFVKGAAGEPTLLSFEDARTLFHEFGHALHGLLSDVTYPMIAGTNVAGDFVELPSQLYEHWLIRPEVLERFARHAETDEPIPGDLLERLIAARNFNQGFASVEYLASAIIDMDLHERAPAEGERLDIDALEAESLARIAMPAEIAPRHRPGHFLHLFAGDGYAAGYYGYLWAEVMDADAFAAFLEAGNVFDPEIAARLRETIYAAGGRQDPADAYTAFRGRLPAIDALLEKRGLAPARASA